MVKTKCPKCKTEISVADDQSEQKATCASCQSTFIPAKVIAESNKRFETWMYIVMILVGLGLFAYMGMTGQLKQKRDEPQPPPAVQKDAGK